MLGLSRWTEKGGSYRTVQRFFYTVIPWAQVFWAFFREHLLDRQDTYLLAGDEMCGDQSRQANPRFGLLFLQPAAKSGSRVVLFHVGLGEHEAATLVSSLCGTDDPHSRRKSCQQGQKASQEGQTWQSKAETWTTKGQSQQKQGRSGAQSRVAAHPEDAAKLLEHHPGHDPSDLSGAWTVILAIIRLSTWFANANCT